MKNWSKPKTEPEEAEKKSTSSYMYKHLAEGGGLNVDASLMPCDWLLFSAVSIPGVEPWISIILSLAQTAQQFNIINKSCKLNQKAINFIFA